MKRPVILFKFGTFGIDEKKIQHDSIFNVVPEVGFQLTENCRIPFNSILQFMIIRLLEGNLVPFEDMCQIKYDMNIVCQRNSATLSNTFLATIETDGDALLPVLSETFLSDLQ